LEALFIWKTVFWNMLFFWFLRVAQEEGGRRSTMG
jgi:hypothetical protein